VYKKGAFATCAGGGQAVAGSRTEVAREWFTMASGKVRVAAGGAGAVSWAGAAVDAGPPRWTSED